MLGQLGEITFEVSAKVVKTFQDLSRTEAGRWSTQDIVQRKPSLEFLGPGLGTVSFKMKFNAALGVNPRKETDNLIRMAREGKVVPFVLGGKRVGVAKWAVKSVDVDYKYVDNRGNVIIAEANVSLEEYV